MRTRTLRVGSWTLGIASPSPGAPAKGGIHFPKQWCHTKAWETASRTVGATPKTGSLYPQLKGLDRGLDVHIPKSKAHTKQ